ncbi:MAG: EAL domain-containing protein, partial [Gammaproteobacteria bacterium]|nr:EAL domain-containing protein [Gammaproteobacteria bacterium]
MGLRTKILFWYITLTLLALITFGINSYYITREVAEKSEFYLLENGEKMRIKMLFHHLSSDATFEELGQVIVTTNVGKEDFAAVVDTKAKSVRGVDVRAPEYQVFLAWQKQQALDIAAADHGIFYFNDAIYHWILHPIVGTEYSLLSVSERAQAHADTPLRLALRLASFGVVIFWISIWIIFIIATSVSKKLAAQSAELEKQAFNDALTNLPNRTFLHKLLADSVEQSIQQSGMVILLVLDIDRFKEINDTLGHHVGDTVLKLVATRLRGTIWARDTIARLGGDEFALLLPVSNKAHCQLVIEKILKAMEEPFVTENMALDVSATVGISLYPSDSVNPAELISHAEVAMYEAKHRNEQFLYYDQSFDPHSVERLNLIADLRHATERDEFFLCYQPLIDIRTGRIDGAEALVRWNSSTRGLVMPDKFIPLAEQTGIIKTMTHLIIEKAVAQCAEWQKKGINLKISVNLSARLVHDKNIPGVVENALQTYAVKPSSLEFEITESAVMLDAAKAIEVMTRLSDMGSYLAVDDFGTGYTSLAYLKSMPVHTIK